MHQFQQISPEESFEALVAYGKIGREIWTTIQLRTLRGYQSLKKKESVYI